MGSATQGFGSTVETVLLRLVRDQRQVLGAKLVGSYLFGSVVTGDLEPDISDVDTVAVLTSNLTAVELASLDEIHGSLVAEMPAWEDRVEVTYVTSAALETFRTVPSPAARISPGEPFHAIEVDDRWLIDWYRLREIGVALYGPPAASVVPPISHEEYVEAVRRHVIDAPTWVDDIRSQGAQAYAILTMCRGLRTSRTGEYVSKREAARWASDALPEHRSTILEAVVWREQARVGDAEEGLATLERTRRFVRDVVQLVAGDHGEAHRPMDTR